MRAVFEKAKAVDSQEVLMAWFPCSSDPSFPKAYKVDLYLFETRGNTVKHERVPVDDATEMVIKMLSDMDIELSEKAVTKGPSAETQAYEAEQTRRQRIEREREGEAASEERRSSWKRLEQERGE